MDNMKDKVALKAAAEKMLSKLQDVNLDDVQAITFSLVLKGAKMRPEEDEEEVDEDEEDCEDMAAMHQSRHGMSKYKV